MKIKLTTLAIIALSALGVSFVVSQGVIVGNFGVNYVFVAPTGSCSSQSPMRQTIPAGGVYTCQNGTWAQVSGGGGTGFPITIGSTSIAASSTTTAITGLTIDGVSPTTMGFVDATSSIQTQLNGKQAAFSNQSANTVYAGPASGAAAAPGFRSLVALDIPPVSVTVDTSTPVSVSSTNPSEYHFNENATAGTAVTYNLPTAAAGKQFCFANANNGSAANTGVLTVATSASGQFIIFTDGTLSATGGNVTSGGAAADASCVVGVDSTHWMLYTQKGTWTKH